MKNAVVGVGLLGAIIIALALALTRDTAEVIEAAAPETTTSTTSEPPETTTTAPPSTSPPSTLEVNPAADGLEVLPPELLTDIEFAQIGETFVRFRVQSSAETAFTAVVTRDGETVATEEGLLDADEVRVARVEGLEPGTVYSVQATLIGPPAVESSVALFRTPGSTPDPAVDALTDQVEIEGLQVSRLAHDQIQFDYSSNVCANGSFIIVEQATGEEVGRNNGLPDGCVSRHLGVPGLWTPPLTPETTYVILVSLEANGANRGRPTGNTATESLVVTTAPRPTPEDPSIRQPDDVVITAIEQAETDHESVRIDYSTNVCTNGSFVIREADGDEVGRHDGFPRGCSTEHSAIPGLWTDALEPDTNYVVLITAEADGAGQGEGNVATETINVRTTPLFEASDDPPTPARIAGLTASVEGGQLAGSFNTNTCATADVAVFATAGDLVALVDTGSTCRVQHSFGPFEVDAPGGYSIIVNVEGEEFSPIEQNRSSSSFVIPFVG